MKPPPRYPEPLTLAPAAAAPPAKQRPGIGNSTISVSRLRSDHGLPEPKAMPVSDSFSVIVQLKTFARHRLWHGQRVVYDGGHAAGSVSIAHMGDEITCQHLSPFDNVRFAFSQRAFDRLCDDDGQTRMTGLDCARGTDDPILHHLAQALLPTLAEGTRASMLFLDHVALAVQSHVARRYGQWKTLRPGGALSRTQEQRAKALIEQHLDGHLSLHRLAAECGLSAGHFARQFRRSTGVSPHQWLIQRRIAKASEMLATTTFSLAQIATACGFADQSHFTNTFRRRIGEPPGVWRARR
jgi:AraC family transcriptional regulator